MKEDIYKEVDERIEVELRDFTNHIQYQDARGLDIDAGRIKIFQLFIHSELSIAEKKERERVIKMISDYIKSVMPLPMTREEEEEFHCEAAILHTEEDLLEYLKLLAYFSYMQEDGEVVLFARE